jgi:hypothetical protein
LPGFRRTIVIEIELLSVRQHRAIAALLERDTIVEAAGVVRVSERTVRRWLEEPAFNAELRRRRDGIVGTAALTLARGMNRAAVALVAMADGTAPASAARTVAAKAVLESGIALIEFSSMEARIADLEKALAVSRTPAYGGRPS